VSDCQHFSRVLLLLAACVAASLSAERLAAEVPRRATEEAVPIVDASDLHQPTSFADGWLVETGDNPAWADPGYDDSHWQRINTETGSLHNLFPGQRPSVVWYRLHLKVAQHDVGLGAEEYFLGSAFEVYSNGVKILKVGSVSPFSAHAFFAHLLALIPADQIATGKIVIAVRTHVSTTEWATAYPGIYYTNLVFGQDGALREDIWLRVIGGNAINVILCLGCLCMVAGGLVLYSAQRRPEYLYLTLTYLMEALSLLPVFLFCLSHLP
jgi:phosphoserine phosphatase RsbU/P